jgi:hypothetical protein
MALNLSMWNVKKYTPQCNKTVEVTTLLNDSKFCSLLPAACEARI